MSSDPSLYDELSPEERRALADFIGDRDLRDIPQLCRFPRELIERAKGGARVLRTTTELLRAVIYGGPP